jgi:MinD superfamily P-loop ATPase
VVINRDEAGGEKVERYCHEQGIPILLKIPLERKIAEFYSQGTPLIEGMPEWRSAFLELFQEIQQNVKMKTV